jgi:ABC-2 type transport system permease protein
MTAHPYATPGHVIDQEMRRGLRITRSLRRIAALSRAELLLLLRNKVMMVNALIIAPAMVFFVISVLPVRPEGSMLLMQMVLWAASFVIYYNLTSIFVSRREERVFARMETGEASKWEALIAASVPSVSIASLQVVMAGVAGKVWLGGTIAAHPIKGFLGFLCIIVTFVALAAATTSFTKSVEAAQLTTMPILFALLLTSGLLLPAEMFARPIQIAISYNPLAALADVLTGAESSRVLPALVVLMLWAVVACVLARRYTAFSPRR